MKREYTKNKFPSPNCESGYSWDYVGEILDKETFEEFAHWMAGQTGAICDGRNYNHETREYEPSSCVEDPHGYVVYSWDLHRFLGFRGQAARDLWD